MPDNLKAAVIRAAFGASDEVVLNLASRELARHYGFKIDPTPPYSPEKKGKVESGVKYVQRNFMRPRRDQKYVDGRRATCFAPDLLGGSARSQACGVHGSQRPATRVMRSCRLWADTVDSGCRFSMKRSVTPEACRRLLDAGPSLSDADRILLEAIAVGSTQAQAAASLKVTRSAVWHRLQRLLRAHEDRSLMPT